MTVTTPSDKERAQLNIVDTNTTRALVLTASAEQYERASALKGQKGKKSLSGSRTRDIREPSTETKGRSSSHLGHGSKSIFDSV